MKKILLPMDFSQNSTKAMTYAAEMAQRTGASIHLLHVLEHVTDSVWQPFPLHENLKQEIEKTRLADLKAIKKSMASMYPKLTIDMELAKGAITTSVLNSAQSNQVDLIVMGTKGATGLKEIFMGSVAAGTIGRTKIPVLAVPDGYVFEVPKCILFATNHFEKKPDLLKRIVEVANIFSASVHVAVFVDPGTAAATDYIYNAMQLNLYVDFLKKTYPGIYFKGELLEGSEFEETIEKYETTNEVDIMAMITYPKSFWDRLMNTSATRKMAFHSKVPVLAIPVT